MIQNARPLLMRAQVIEAVLAAQTVALEPVTSQEARSAKPVMRHTRAFTEVAEQISHLGPDERGRVLRAAGRDRKGLALWWVQEPGGETA
jgi:hypothetical protein